MISSKWQKRNTAILNRGLMIAFASAALAGLFLASIGQARWGEIIAFAIVVAGYLLTFRLTYRYANSMIRVLKFDYVGSEQGFRKMFSDNHIRYNLKTEDESYQYTFSGTSLKMTVEPHVRYPFRNETLDRYMDQLPETQVTLGEINARNRTFAEKLAGLIDDMAIQPPYHQDAS